MKKKITVCFPENVKGHAKHCKKNRDPYNLL